MKGRGKGLCELGTVVYRICWEVDVDLRLRMDGGVGMDGCDFGIED